MPVIVSEAIDQGREVCRPAVVPEQRPHNFDQLLGAKIHCKSMVYKWCPGAESNHRHEDFQSTALPLSYPGTGSGGWPPLGLGLLDKGRGGGKREKREFSEV